MKENINLIDKVGISQANTVKKKSILLMGEKTGAIRLSRVWLLDYLSHPMVEMKDYQSFASMK